MKLYFKEVYEVCFTKVTILGYIQNHFMTFPLASTLQEFVCSTDSCLDIGLNKDPD